MKRVFLRITVVFAFVLLLTGYAAAAEVSYADIPDGFPIPTLNGAPIPYEYVSLPEEGWMVTSYVYSISEPGFMDSYKEQLREAGFVDQGSAGHIESLWRYDRSGDGASLIVEMFHEESNFSINMYVNYL